MLSKSSVIHERTNIVPIFKKISTLMKEISDDKIEYSLKQNFFDPSKSSPPNEFMIKLHMRISNYTASHIKDDNRDSE
jgi:hypothetical protein